MCIYELPPQSELSFRRKPESSPIKAFWMPDQVGMTENAVCGQTRSSKPYAPCPMLYAISFNTKEERKMEKMRKTMTTIFAIAILIIPTMGIAGSLEPPPGSVGPSGPVSTMKTLDQIPPTWSLTLPGAQRFEQLSTYVTLDKETGLVWSRILMLGGWNWAGSQDQCRRAIAGGRMGWRLPTIEELTSLLESSTDLGITPPVGSSSASLPVGHPFYNNVLTEPVWAATSSPYSPSEKLKLNLNTGEITSHDPAISGSAICVRGGAGFEN